MQLFTMRQKGQLDVYGLWGVLRGQLLTDDSFVYNRVLSRLKDSIQHLPEATEEDDEALLRVKVPLLGLPLLAPSWLISFAWVEPRPDVVTIGRSPSMGTH